MDIRVLEYFLAVAREESITKAAKALSMTQPPLSRQLKELEDELGKQLFIRGNKKVTLTEEGILLRKRAEELIELMEKTKEEIRSSEERIHGTVLIGAGESDAVSFLARTARRLQMSHPDISYHLYSGDATSITEKLDHGLIDFGLLVEPVDISKYEYLRLPAKDTWGVLMRRDSPLAVKDQILAEDLWEKPLLVSHQIYDSSELSSWFQRDIRKLHITAAYELLYNATHFVKSGCGYALSLDKLINTTGESELTFRPLYPALDAGLCFVWKKHQIFSRASRLYLDTLKKDLAL
ncbi:LysR family transcriptional regulator [Merdimonas faecis]|uniref:LysR family transcriptional regulator n=1 Tax=Merdimonas faecis TaxID=1653435 RepID=UPI0023F6BC3F|nr:LysR family transcriptional regulator [Merdimonas faecis]